MSIIPPAPDPRAPHPDPFADSPDPLIDEIREVRRQIDKQFGGDIDKLASALRDRQQRSGRKIISDHGSPPKRTE